MTIQNSVLSILNNIKKVENTPVSLVAVSKKISVDKINQAIEAGVTILGESYVQEFLEKYSQIQKKISWHFIGQLQKNKVKYIIDKVDLIHSVDRLDLAEEIDKQAERVGKIQNLLIQVKLYPEETKGGIDGNSLGTLINSVKCLKNIYISGLMLIPPFDDDIQTTRGYFSQMKLLADQYFPNQSPIISMGMSHDYIEAIEEGANMVRVGTALFGERLY